MNQDHESDDEDLAIANALLGKNSHINLGRNIQLQQSSAQQEHHHNHQPTQSLLHRLAPPSSKINKNNKSTAPLSSRISNHHLRHQSCSPIQSTSYNHSFPRRFSTPSIQQHHLSAQYHQPKVSILIQNLPPYSALTPKQLYEHLTNLALAINQQSNNNTDLNKKPYALNLYRYTRSDCVCAELKFNNLTTARHFLNHANPIWPHIWYTYSKISPPIDSQKKFMQFSLLDHDKPISWPSRCESYYPKFKPDSYHHLTRHVQREEQLPETSHPSSRPTHTAEFKRRKSTVPNLTPTNLPVKHQADCYRPKARGAYQDNLPPKKKARTPSLQTSSLKEEEKSHEIIKNQISLLLSQSSTASTSNPLPQNSTNLPNKITSDLTQLPSDPKATHDKQPDPPTALSITTPSSNLSVITGAGSSKISGLVGDGSPPLTIHSDSSKSPPECADTRFPNPLFTMERIQKERDNDSTMSRMMMMERKKKKGVLLCKMLPSINLSVLQSHFLIPNRPRDFRIFEPRQISYGPFLSTNNTAPDHQNNNNHHKNALDQLEIGCLISFSDASTAAHFSRVLHLNSPFHPLQVQLVDPADIQFLPSATTISNPPKPHQQEQQQQTRHHVAAAGASYTPGSGYFPTTTTTYLDGLSSEYTPWTRRHPHHETTQASTGSVALQLQSPPPVPPHPDIPAYSPYSYLADFSLLTHPTNNNHGHLEGLASSPSSSFPPFLLASEVAPLSSSSSSSQLFFPASLHPTPDEPLRANPLSSSSTNDHHYSPCQSSFPTVHASASSSEPTPHPPSVLLPSPHPNHHDGDHDDKSDAKPDTTDAQVLHQLRLKKILQARKVALPPATAN